MCASLSSARVALRPVSSGTPRAPHTRSRPRARGSPGPRAPPIAVSGGGEAPACGARLHLKEEEEEEEDHEQLGGALDQEGDGDGGVIGRLTNVQKTTNLVTRGFPNAELETFSKFAAERVASSSIRFRLFGD